MLFFSSTIEIPLLFYGKCYPVKDLEMEIRKFGLQNGVFNVLKIYKLFFVFPFINSHLLIYGMLVCLFTFYLWNFMLSDWFSRAGNDDLLCQHC